MMARELGALLTLLRERQGLTQKEIADRLCQVSGQITVTRHEVSRWEREERVPTDFWLGWLSKVLNAPVAELQEARARSKGVEQMATKGDKPPEKVPGTKWRDYGRSLRESSLALVTLKFEHRATSVQLNGTYEEPEQATAAIGMFRRMVTPEVASTAAAEEPVAQAQASENGRSSTARGGAASNETGSKQAGAAAVSKRPVPNPVPSSARPAPVAPRPDVTGARSAQPTPAPPGAAPNGSSPMHVPMGIRYTKGPGVDNKNDARSR